MLRPGDEVRERRLECEEPASQETNPRCHPAGFSDRNLIAVEDHGNPAYDSQSMASGRYGLTRFVEPFFYYYKTLVVCVLVGVLLGWVALLVWPRTYESLAKLQLLVGRESVGLDPSSTTTPTLLMQKTLEEDINSALEILGGRDVAELVIQELGVDPILNGTLPTAMSADSNPGFRTWLNGLRSTVSELLGALVSLSGVRDPISDHERAVIRLEQTVNVFAPKKSSTMIVRAQSKTPEMAQAIAASYVKHFIDRHVNVATTEGSHAFFEQQSRVVEAELSQILKRRGELLQEHKMVSASSRFGALTSQQSAIEATILNTLAQTKQAEAEMDDLTHRIQNLDAEIVSNKQTQPDQTIIGMRISLYNAELEEKRLLARYSDGHPQLKQIQKQVVAAREALDKLEQDSESLSTTPNPIRLKLEEDLLRTKTRIVGLESLLVESKQQLSDKLQEINELLEVELQLDHLDREVELAKKNLATLREKEEQSRVVEHLRQQRISSVGIAQSASLTHKASKPKKPLIAAAALMLSLGFGICLVGLKELSRRQIRSADDIRRFLGYPVLTEIPLVQNLSDSKIEYSDLRSERMDAIRNGCEALQAELILSFAQEMTDEHRGRIIGIVGVDDECGASLLSMMLALQYSESNHQRTTLIDLDTKKGTVSSVFGLVSQPNDAAQSDSRDDSTVRLLQINDRSLNLVGSTSQSIASLEKGSLKNLLTMLDQLAECNDVVILDFPPVGRPDRVLSVVSQLDQIVVIVESQKTSMETALRLVRQIEKCGGQIAGVVLTKSSRYMPQWLEKLLG